MPFDARITLSSAKDGLRQFKERLAIYQRDAKPKATAWIPLKGKNGRMGYLVGPYPSAPDGCREAAYRVVTDLRAALDHAIFEASVMMGSNDEENIYFPFVESENDFDGTIQSKRFSGIPIALHSVLKKTTPWWTGAPLKDRFRLLGILANPNKHRTPLKPIPAIESINIANMHQINLEAMPDLGNDFGACIPIAITPIGPNPRFEFDLPATLVIDHERAEANTPAVYVFHSMIQHVEDSITLLEQAAQ